MWIILIKRGIIVEDRSNICTTAITRSVVSVLCRCSNNHTAWFTHR